MLISDTFNFRIPNFFMLISDHLKGGVYYQLRGTGSIHVRADSGADRVPHRGAERGAVGGAEPGALEPTE